MLELLEIYFRPLCTHKRGDEIKHQPLWQYRQEYLAANGFYERLHHKVTELERQSLAPEEAQKLFLGKLLLRTYLPNGIKAEKKQILTFSKLTLDEQGYLLKLATIDQQALSILITLALRDWDKSIRNIGHQLIKTGHYKGNIRLVDQQPISLELHFPEYEFLITSPYLDLSYAHFGDQELQNQDFSGMSLYGCNLTSAKLNDAKFRATCLDEADFSNGTLTGADFTRASLIHATLENAKANDASFTRANLHRANCRDFIGKRSDFKHANLSAANFSLARLSKADLKYANLIQVNLRNAHLIGTDLGYANLFAANLERAHIRRAKFLWANLNLANLNHAVGNALGVESSEETVAFVAAQLNGANFRESNLAYANFAQAEVRHTNFTEANAIQGNFTKALVDDQTKFTGSHLRHANVRDVRNLTARHLRSCSDVKHAEGNSNINLIIEVITDERRKEKYKKNAVYYPLHVIGDKIFANVFGYILGFEWVFDLSKGRGGYKVKLPEFSFPENRFGYEVVGVEHVVNGWNFWAVPFNYIARNLAKPIGYIVAAPIIGIVYGSIELYYGGKKLHAWYNYRDVLLPDVPPVIEQIGNVPREESKEGNAALSDVEQSQQAALAVQDRTNEEHFPRYKRSHT